MNTTNQVASHASTLITSSSLIGLKAFGFITRRGRIPSCLLSCCILATNASAAISLTGFSVENASNTAPGDWALNSSLDTVSQSLNSDSTIYYSSSNYGNHSISGTMRVSTANDDDFIGIVAGFIPGSLSSSSPTATYLLIDWKQAPQSVAGQTAQKGLAASLVTNSSLNLNNFFVHDGGVVEIGRAATLGNVGWTDYAVYPFRLDYLPEEIRFYVNGALEMTIEASSISPSFTFPEGRFGFYSTSQENAVFTLTDVTAVPEPSSTLLLGMGVLGFITRRKRIA